MKIFSAIFLTFLFAITAFGQTGNITNTLATGGSFLVKDGSTTFLTLNQSTGNLSLNNILTLPVSTGSGVGVIYKGANPFIHDFQVAGTDGYNTFVGINSGNFTMSGGTGFLCSYNTSLGGLSLNSLTTGYMNSAIGYGSLYLNTNGYQNCAFGSGSLYQNSSGYQNCAFGSSTLFWNTSGIQNSAFGGNSLYKNTTGNYNSAFGANSLYSNLLGWYNSAFGSNSLYNNLGWYNSSFGNEALYNNIGGQWNSAFGDRSLHSNSSGNYNCSFGESSLHENTTAWYNSAFGNGSLYGNTTGWYNSAFGNQALVLNNTGHQNTAVGHNSLYSNTSGSQNTAVGDSALYYNTSNYNTALGYNAGSSVTTGYNLTLVGIDANPSSGSAANEITLGNTFVTALRCNASLSGLSDARDKKNIRDLPLGLDFLMTLKPRLFNWDRREWYKDGKPDGSKMQQTPTAGFIAQELDTAQINANAEYLNLVLKTNPERLEATPGNLLPIIVKAVQEINLKCQELQSKNEKLENTVQILEQQLNELNKNENVIKISNSN